MRRFATVGAVLAMGTVLGVLAPVAASTAAWADAPQHIKATLPTVDDQQAGDFCDFHYHMEGTIYANAVIFADGHGVEQITWPVTHTNVDTGFTLTDIGHFSYQLLAGQEKYQGIFWHLRNADGKIVVVQAGQIAFSEGQVLTFTPNANPDMAAVVCPALGGHPAS